MIYLIILMLFVPTVLVTAFMPYITRRTESFGVSIPESIYSSPELMSYRKQYAIRTSVFGVILLAVSLVAGQFLKEDAWMIFQLIALFVFLFGSFMIYFQFHKRMKQLKAVSNWKQSKTEATIIDTAFRNRKLIFSNGWFVISLAITAITIALTVINFDNIPNKFPMQYDFDGNVTNWADKSYGSVFGLPLMQLFMIGLFMFINGVIGRSRQQIDAENPERSIIQNVIFRRRWSAFLIITATALITLFSFMQAALFIEIDQKVLLTISLILTGAIVIGAAILSIVTGQGGSRLKTVAGKNGEHINRDEDRYWKLGIFYFNSADPAIWVEKRFGSGFTVNMAKPQAWVFFLIILLIPILISFLS